jgi:lipopolysaccharide exporter
MMTGKLSKEAFSALRWNYLGFLSRSFTNVFVGILLARLLGPKPFGELAAAALVIGIANLIADAGFTSALVQAPELTELQIRYVFTIQFLIAIALTMTTIAVAGPVATSFHDPLVRPVLWAISPTFLIQAFGQTSNALLRRELAFRNLQVAQMTSYGISLIVVLPLALRGAGVWSLIIAQLTQAVVYAALVYLHVRHSVLPSLHRSGAELLRYGSKVTIVNVTNWGISNLDNALVGHTFGSTGLGLYSRAFNLGSAPADSIVSTLQQVLFAACSRAEGRIESIRRAYFGSLCAIALIIFPAFWSMAACSETVVVGLFGPIWKPSAVLFRPLAIAISINAVMALAGPILNAVGRVRREMIAQAWSLVVAVVVFLVLSRVSMTAFAWGVCGVYVFRFVTATLPTLEYLEVGWKDVFKVLRGPLACALSTSLCLWAVDHLTRSFGIPPLPRFCVLLALGSFLLGTQVIFFGHHLISEHVVNFLRNGTKLPGFAILFLDRIAAKQGWSFVSTPATASDIGG